MQRPHKTLFVAAMLFGVPAGSAPEHRHGGAGSVQFPVSCSAPAQDTFQHGVALLHSFWYDEAEKTFRKAAVRPGLRDGLVGSRHESLSSRLGAPARVDLKTGAAAVEKAKSAAAKTQREARLHRRPSKCFTGMRQTWRTRIGQLAWSRAMRQFRRRYPEDREAVDLLRSVVDRHGSRRG